MQQKTKAAAVLVLTLGVGATTGKAFAHGAGDGVPISVPPAPPGDGAKAEALLKAIEARALADKSTAAIVGDTMKKAKTALQRAYGARSAGDANQARLCDGLALEWAETARELERAAAAERVAQASAKAADDLATKVDRTRALLGESQARHGRASVELERVQAESKESAKGAAQSEDARIAASKKAGNKSKDAPKKKGSP